MDTMLLAFCVNEELLNWKIIGNIFDNNFRKKG